MLISHSQPPPRLGAHSISVSIAATRFSVRNSPVRPSVRQSVTITSETPSRSEHEKPQPVGTSENLWCPSPYRDLLGWNSVGDDIIPQWKSITPKQTLSIAAAADCRRGIGLWIHRIPSTIRVFSSCLWLYFTTRCLSSVAPYSGSCRILHRDCGSLWIICAISSTSSTCSCGPGPVSIRFQLVLSERSIDGDER